MQERAPETPPPHRFNNKEGDLIDKKQQVRCRKRERESVEFLGEGIVAVNKRRGRE
jgi:hypothetical protein